MVRCDEEGAEFGDVTAARSIPSQYGILKILLFSLAKNVDLLITGDRPEPSTGPVLSGALGLSDFSNQRPQLDAFNQLIHVGLSNPDYRKNPKILQEKVGLSPNRFNQILHDLTRIGLLENNNGEIRVVKRNLHLPKGAKVFRTWKSQLRQMALQRALSLESHETYNFSVFFSCTDEVRAQIQDLFFTFINGAQKLVTDAKAEKVYQINFDLVPWA